MRKTNNRQSIVSRVRQSYLSGRTLREMFSAAVAPVASALRVQSKQNKASRIGTNRAAAERNQVGLGLESSARPFAGRAGLPRDGEIQQNALIRRFPFPWARRLYQSV